MEILSSRGAPSKATVHDPDFCSIDGYTLCDICRSALERGERELYQRDAAAKERAALAEVARQFLASTGITIERLAQALIPFMTEPFAEMANAVFDERGRP